MACETCHVSDSWHKTSHVSSVCKREWVILMQSRCIGINKIYIQNPTAVAELLQYSGSRVEHEDGFSS